MTSHGIAILGSSGQVARALVREAAARGVHATAGGRPRVDVADYHSAATFLYETQPRVVINAAAYTAVDKAESEPGEAFRGQCRSASPSRSAVRRRAGAADPLSRPTTSSTASRRAPYVESDPIASTRRLRREQSGRRRRGADAIAPGTSSSGRRGSTAAKGTTSSDDAAARRASGEIVSVVDDQHGAPTSADDLADAISDHCREPSSKPRRMHRGGRIT